MAKDITRNPWIFDTVADSEGVANAAETPTPNYDGIPIYVRQIVIESDGTGGDFEVSVSATGPTITGTINLAANDQVAFPVNNFVKGVYLTSIPSGQVLIFHGKER